MKLKLDTKTVAGFALVKGRSDDEARRDQIDSFLRNRPWQEVGEFAAYGCQMTRLGLKPWQWPPAWLEPSEVDAVLAEPDDGQSGRHQAAELLRRMLRAKVSRFHPDPIRALEAAEAKKPKTAA
jgi:hypothetical protein